MSNEIDGSLDGINPDDPGQHPAGRHVSRQAQRLCQDLADLKAMSEADLRHYSA
jgi:hypothetical protein